MRWHLIYLSVNDTNPATFIGGTWESIGSGRVLQGADDTHAAGSTIEAGLPNITGIINRYYGEVSITDGTSGAFTSINGSTKTLSTIWESTHNAISFDASRCNAVYVVYMWQRTA